MVAVLVGGGGVFMWQRRQKAVRDEALAVPVAMKEPELIPPAEFRHPYTDASWLFRTYFTIKRILYLSWVFTPCILGALKMGLRKGDPEVRRQFLELLVDSIERGGCTTIKYGQWCSMRPDLFPEDVCNALAKLRDSAPVHDFVHTQRQLREAFGQDIDEIFESFAQAPTASGSIAQVYRGRLHAKFAFGENGVVDVAVKVRHPNVVDETYVDMSALLASLGVVRLLSGINLQLPFSRDEFYSVLSKQMDFTWEAYNLLVFAKNFREEVTKAAYTGTHQPFLDSLLN
jgi:aarF domain-containing kinase